MPERDPTTYSLITYAWVFLLSIAGGFVAFIRRLNQAPKPIPLHIVFARLAGELLISGFAGVITFYLCEYWSFDGLLTAVMVAISGHLGGSAIDRFTRVWDAFVEKSI